MFYCKWIKLISMRHQTTGSRTIDLNYECSAWWRVAHRSLVLSPTSRRHSRRNPLTHPLFDRTLACIQRSSVPRDQSRKPIYCQYIGFLGKSSRHRPRRALHGYSSVSVYLFISSHWTFDRILFLEICDDNSYVHCMNVQSDWTV